MDQFMGGTEEEPAPNGGNDTEKDFEVGRTREPLERQHKANEDRETAKRQVAAEDEEPIEDEEAANQRFWTARMAKNRRLKSGSTLFVKTARNMEREEGTIAAVQKSFRKTAKIARDKKKAGVF
ncbi:hypothetical protein PWT90_04248 [Aphanocladium album]|nr:hypothetical protein PWT90_04248 [Aphanocladium album]